MFTLQFGHGSDAGETGSRAKNVAVIVEAIDDNAIRFYRHYGFEAFTDQPDKLFLPIRSIEAI